MYHDSYTRRRTTDSFNENDTDSRLQQWQCSLFFGVIIIQVTNRMIWASFGVISSFLLEDNHGIALLLAPSIAYAAAWPLAELGAKRLCRRLVRPVEFIYVTIVGILLSWGGVVLTFKCPLVPSYYVPLLGVLGGCGAGLSTAASSAILQKQMKTQKWMIRVLKLATTSLAVFLAPVLSFFVMDSFGPHGGLLIHSGIILQGLIGAVLLKTGKWEFDQTVVYSVNSDDCTYPSSESSSPELETRNYYAEKRKKQLDQIKIRRLRRKRRKRPPTTLPIISESEEESEYIATKEICSKPAVVPEPNEQEDVGTEDHVEEGESVSELARLKSIPTVKDLSTTDIIIEMPIENSPNLVLKPPRTFEHKFSDGRYIAKRLDAFRNTGTVEVNCQTDEPNRFATMLGSIKTRISSAINIFINPQLIIKAFSFVDPRFLAALLVIFSIELALLTFVALTPSLLVQYVEGVSRMDGSYVICIMGFTWLCSVVASPCLTTAHFTNHQCGILISALLASALTLRMMAFRSSLDGLIFCCSIFGLTHGLCNITMHDVLKLTLGRKRISEIYWKIRTGLSILLLLLMGAIWQWARNQQDVYFTSSIFLAGSAAALGAVGGVTSVRAARGRHDVTWSRRRRLS